MRVVKEELLENNVHFLLFAHIAHARTVTKLKDRFSRECTLFRKERKAGHLELFNFRLGTNNCTDKISFLEISSLLNTFVGLINGLCNCNKRGDFLRFRLIINSKGT